MPQPRIGVEFKQKRNFFDRQAVITAIGKANAAALSRHGAFVQRRSRSSLRRRKKPSAPGNPPSVHTSDPVATLKNIWFAYEPSTAAVVVGPLRLNVHNTVWGGETGRVRTSGAVPGILEHGGRVGYYSVRGADGKWQRVPRRRSSKPERIVPVWKATSAERAASNGVITLYRGGRVLNFYRIPNPTSVLIWHTIAPRPFMGPAGQAELAKDKSGRLWRAS